MEQITELIRQINNPYLAAILIGFLSFLYLTKDSWRDLISKTSLSKILKETSKNPYEIFDLLKHDLFNEIDSYKSHKYEFKTHGKVDITKSKIFNDFLDLKIDSTSKNMALICQKATPEMTRQELKYLVNNCFNACNLTLENRLINKFQEKGLNKKDAEIIMNKFYIVRSEVMGKYNKRIDSIFACDFYRTNFDLVLAIYEVIAFEIEDIIDDGVKCFEEINGTFMELEYEV